MPEAKSFKLPYRVSNGGDGSVSVHFHVSEQAAEKEEEGDSEGWGESSVSSVNIKVEDGKLFFQTHQYIDKKYQQVWIEVPQ